MSAPCIFAGCVATWKHYHGGFPGGYDNPADPEGLPIYFTDPPPEDGMVRDYTGAVVPKCCCLGGSARCEHHKP